MFTLKHKIVMLKTYIFLQITFVIKYNVENYKSWVNFRQKFELSMLIKHV